VNSITTNHPTPSASPKSMQWTERLRDGTVLHIRPITSADAPREHAFLSHLSPELRAFRFLGLIKNASESVARELATDDPSDEVTLVGLVNDGETEIEIGVARYRARREGAHCDCAVTVDPDWQQRGIASTLMQHLIDVARVRGIRRMYAVDAARSAGVHLLAERLGFHSRLDPEDPAVTTFELKLQ